MSTTFIAKHKPIIFRLCIWYTNHKGNGMRRKFSMFTQKLNEKHHEESKHPDYYNLHPKVECLFALHYYR